MVTTKVTPAASNSKSLRTTIPEWVVQTLKIKAGDEVDWFVQPETVGAKTGEMIAIVKKA